MSNIQSKQSTIGDQQARRSSDTPLNMHNISDYVNQGRLKSFKKLKREVVDVNQCFNQSNFDFQPLDCFRNQAKTPNVLSLQSRQKSPSAECSQILINGVKV